MLVGVGVGLAQPWPLALLVDSGLGKHQPPAFVHHLVGDSRSGLLALAVISGVLLTLAAGLISVIDEYVMTRAAQRMTLRYRSKLFSHTLRMSPSFHDSRRKGTLMFTINHHAGCVGDISSAIPALVQNALTVLGMLVVAARLAPWLALLALTVLPVLYHSTGWYGRRIEPRIRSVRDQEGESLSIVYEAMTMLRVILSFGREKHEHARFLKQGTEAVTARIGLSVRQTVFSLVVNTTAAVGTALVLTYGAHLVLSGRLTVGELLVVLSYVAAVYKPLTAISGTIAELQQQLISLEAAVQLEDAEPDVVDRPRAMNINTVSGAITYEHVDFDHPGRVGTLRDISFSVAPGAVVAIVGPTGAGKSTLVSLLPRFADPSAGRILLDGIDLRDYTVESLRGQVSVVLQEALLFSGTIADNIRYGDLDADDAAVAQAAQDAGCAEFIEALPDKYRTVLGERGAQLSGGERQRIAIARAFLRNAPLLILDEPTSAVDSRTEAAILDSLDRLMARRTTFLIAHRLSTIRSASLVLVLDQGRVVQAGTYDELMSRPGLFRELAEAQEVKLVSSANQSEPEGPVVTAPPARQSTSPPPAPLRAPVAPRPLGRPAIVVLGMLTNMPVAGVAWQTLHYLAGFERLGYNAYYVEMYNRTPSMLMTSADDNPTALAAGYLARLFRRFGFADRWAYVPGGSLDGAVGMSPGELRKLFGEAAAIVNLHGGTEPIDVLSETGRLLYLETDPCRLQAELAEGQTATREFLDRHVGFFTFAERYGRSGCALPVTADYDFRPTRQPVVLEFWDSNPLAVGQELSFRTIGNWQQRWRDIEIGSERYSWSKHEEFAKVLDLPSLCTAGRFQLALANLSDEARQTLVRTGWSVRDALAISADIDDYRNFIRGSLAEFTVAKDQNVRLRSGWFSDRSATFLAAGRPVITQDTGFEIALPTGAGLHAFRTIDDAVTAADRVLTDPIGESRAAWDIAHEYFDSDVVLGAMLADFGLPHRLPKAGSAQASALPGHLDLRPVSRRPLQLPEATVQIARERALPMPARGVDGGSTPSVSVVLVTHDELVVTRLMLSTLMADPASVTTQIVVSDNGSSDGTPDLVRRVAARDGRVVLVASETNDGFAAAMNRGIAAATAPVVVLANNDLLLPPGTLSRLAAHLTDPRIGAVGPMTNRSGTAADLGDTYRTWDELLATAEQRAVAHAGRTLEVDVLAFFCVALRRDVLQQVGPLDEQFGLGLFEDDDYCRRLHAAGLRTVLAQDVQVHHHGEATIGNLVPTGDYSRLFAANRAAFEQKWGAAWVPRQRLSEAAAQEAAAVRADISGRLTTGCRVLVVSRGDSRLLDAVGSTGAVAGHFPRTPDGAHPGHHPAVEQVMDAVAAAVQQGWTHLLLPETSRWWLERYADLGSYLMSQGRLEVDGAACRVFRLTSAFRPQSYTDTLAMLT
jgi:ABC-type multidrug transport system fused ATPase/permease subunit/GT2 family glycosyltransferase